MDNFQYLALLAGCLVCTVPLEFIYGFRVWRDPARLFRALLPVVCFFICWDLFGIHRGNWWFNGDYVTGITLPGDIPIEELLFFIVIPAAAISGYEAVKASLASRRNA